MTIFSQDYWGIIVPPYPEPKPPGTPETRSFWGTLLIVEGKSGNSLYHSGCGWHGWCNCKDHAKLLCRICQRAMLFTIVQLGMILAYARSMPDCTTGWSRRQVYNGIFLLPSLHIPSISAPYARICHTSSLVTYLSHILAYFLLRACARSGAILVRFLHMQNPCQRPYLKRSFFYKNMLFSRNPLKSLGQKKKYPYLSMV